MNILRRLSLLGPICGSIAFTGAAEAQPSACDTALKIDLPSGCSGIEASHPVEGLENFRELMTPDAGIKPNTLFRSDQLDELSEEAITTLNAIGIETIVDLRAPDELQSHPNKHIPSVDFNVNLPIGSDPADVTKIMPIEIASQIRPMWFEGRFDEIDQILADHNVNLRQIRIDRYQDFATNFNPQISRFLHLLTDGSNFPLLFHCAGGKDRTGYMAAITLLTLGYSEDDVMRDYLTTNVFTYGELEELVGKGPRSLRPAFGAHPEQIKASIEAIQQSYGSFEAYRRDVLGISDDEVATIRKNLLVGG